ncbi:CLUMA_CG003139, isoform A [Clunio marinus]|uniref:CLUMA_CG003139, isoform A n=1 Tax=Clunio marinus TaxID=568069 RepID=A0A1J1HT62_9DIPT|nr:CLUMA_CG003139, isoform A [Clunio marinus]
MQELKACAIEQDKQWNSSTNTSGFDYLFLACVYNSVVLTTHDITELTVRNELKLPFHFNVFHIKKNTNEKLSKDILLWAISYL